MSVAVKTPTRTQYDHSEFQCGEKTKQNSARKSHFHKQETASTPQGIKKRRHSNYVQNKHNPNVGQGHHSFKKRRFSTKSSESKDIIKLPTNFLLGGNISDPLNLSGLCDDEAYKAVNQETPYSSPLTTPAHRKERIEVMIPLNITDPLNLNDENSDCALVSPYAGSGKKRKKPRHYKKRSDDSEPCDHRPANNDASTDKGPNNRPMTLSSGGQSKPVKDKIVSPVVQQVSPKQKRGCKKNLGNYRRPEPSGGVSKALLHESKEAGANKDSRPTDKKKGRGKFSYGNYNRYYGYRNANTEKDARLKAFNKEWFDGKDVLDIGCNIGHVTLTVAKELNPKKIVGVDIDSHLIKIARRNIRHYLSPDRGSGSTFPKSMALQYGPIAAPVVREIGEKSSFPKNILFLQANYVLESDELLDLQREEYDMIMCLSVTKWIHLNYGDDGIKRVFKRMYKQLKPGGRLILEPQGFASYKKKKKITEEIHKTFLSIVFKPEQFTEYLLSRDVGFSTCETLDVPFNKAKGFRRPLQLFTKAEPPSCATTPAIHVFSGPATPSSDVLAAGWTPSGTNTPSYSNPNTPKFYISSASNTPNYDSSSSGETTPGPCTPLISTKLLDIIEEDSKDT